MQPAVHRLSMEYRTGRSDREMEKKSIYSLAPLPGRHRNTKRQTDLGIPSPHFRILILSIWNVLVQDSHRPLVHDGRCCLAHIIIFRFFFKKILRENKKKKYFVSDYFLHSPLDALLCWRLVAGTTHARRFCQMQMSAMFVSSSSCLIFSCCAQKLTAVTQFDRQNGLTQSSS